APGVGGDPKATAGTTGQRPDRKDTAGGANPGITIGPDSCGGARQAADRNTGPRDQTPGRRRAACGRDWPTAPRTGSPIGAIGPAVGGGAATTASRDAIAPTVAAGTAAIEEIPPVGRESAGPGAVTPAIGRSAKATAGAEGELPGRTVQARSADPGIVGRPIGNRTEGREYHEKL